jgi:hypothetical protein
MSLAAILSLAEVHVTASLSQHFTTYVGIDWADTKHDICRQSGDENHRQFDCIPHQVDRIDEWAKALHQRFGGPIAVALELAKGPIVSALLKYDFFVLFPINPSTLAKYRVAFKPSRAKDDPTDAELALDLLLRHPERFTALRPQSVAMRSLLSLIEQRRDLVNDKTRLPTVYATPSSSITRRHWTGLSSETLSCFAISSLAGRHSCQPNGRVKPRLRRSFMPITGVAPH